MKTGLNFCFIIFDEKKLPAPDETNIIPNTAVTA